MAATSLPPARTQINSPQKPCVNVFLSSYQLLDPLLVLGSQLELMLVRMRSCIPALPLCGHVEAYCHAEMQFFFLFACTSLCVIHSLSKPGWCKTWTLDSGLDSWTGLWTEIWTRFWTDALGDDDHFQQQTLLRTRWSACIYKACRGRADYFPWKIGEGCISSGHWASS